MDPNPDIDEYYSADRFEVLTVQLTEAKRLMLSESPSHLRIAYILLDNAAEVIMHRSIYPELIENDFYETLLRRWNEIVEVNPSAEAFEKRQEALQRVIPAKKLRELDRDFMAKANFLVARNKMDRGHADALKRLHEYRNEMYHRDHIRRSVVQVFTYMHFELVCSMLESYDATTRHPYVGPPIGAFPEDRMATFKPPATVIADELREGFDVAWNQAAFHLKDQLIERIEKVIAGAWIVTMVFADVDESLAIKLAQTFDASPTDSPEELKQLEFPYKYERADLDRWLKRANKLDLDSDKIKFFNFYGSLERDFEQSEKDMLALRKELERMRQRQLDLAEEDAKIERHNRPKTGGEPG
ncbi:hypothetical protein AB0M02_46590 [Actinoplanes sp. NPDC051861]|uniref:hypothetical protein n=1 Tax=Actinoplanes sp. NPDC051861 TaxID=3155170 RepID=UPI00341B762A